MQLNKEVVWHINNAVVVLAVGQERCTKRLARNVRKNAKSLLSPGKIVRYIAKTVFQSERTAADKRRPYWPEIITRIKSTREN